MIAWLRRKRSESAAREAMGRRLRDLQQKQHAVAYFNGKCRASGNPHLCLPIPTE